MSAVDGVTGVASRVVPVLRRRVVRWTDGAALAAARAALAQSTVEPPTGGWTVSPATWTTTGLVVLLAGAAGAPPVVVVKVARTPAAARSLRRHRDVLARLEADDRLVDWRHQVPRVLASGTCDGYEAVVESAMPGAAAVHLLPDPRLRALALGGTLEVAHGLHERTAAPYTVDDDLLADWVDGPADVLGDVLRRPAHGTARAQLEQLRAALRADLRGRTVQAGWIHGDCWPGNVMTGPDGRVTGLIDWDLAQPAAPALHDVLHALLYPRRLRRRQSLGRVVVDVWRHPEWDPVERAALEALPVQAWSGLPPRTALALYWLRHVGSLGHQPDHGGNRLWVQPNVVRVLAALARD